MVMGGGAGNYNVAVTLSVNSAVLKQLITGGHPGAAGGNGGGGGGNVSSTLKQLYAIDKSLQIMISNSRVANTYMGAMGKMFGAAMDILLIPFIPIFNLIMVFMSKLLQWLIKSGTLDKMVEYGKTVATKIMQLVDWFGSWKDKAWSTIGSELTTGIVGAIRQGWAALKEDPKATIGFGAVALGVAGGIWSGLNALTGGLLGKTVGGAARAVGGVAGVASRIPYVGPVVKGASTVVKGAGTVGMALTLSQIANWIIGDSQSSVSKLLRILSSTAAGVWAGKAAGGYGMIAGGIIGAGVQGYREAYGDYSGTSAPAAPQKEPSKVNSDNTTTHHVSNYYNVPLTALQMLMKATALNGIVSVGSG